MFSLFLTGFELNHEKAFVILNRHTSFQLYHCYFPSSYLKHVYENGVADTSVILNRTRSYDFANVRERGEWFDIFIALLQYLKSGESKVGYLNAMHPKNPLHRVFFLTNSFLMEQVDDLGVQDTTTTELQNSTLVQNEPETIDPNSTSPPTTIDQEPVRKRRREGNFPSNPLSLIDTAMPSQVSPSSQRYKSRKMMKP